MIDYPKVLKDIEAIHRERPRAKHPMWQGLMAGTFNRAQTREFIFQFGAVPLYNHGYHGRLYVTCPDAAWRERIAEVVYEEGTGRLFASGVPHYKLYLRLGAAFGLTRDEMYNRPLCAGSVAYKAYFEQVCGKSFLEGVSAHMLSGETEFALVSGQTGKTMQKKFNLTDEEIAFYTVHDEADKEHGDIGRELLEHFAKTEDDVQLVLKTVREYVGVSYLMYDDILRVMNEAK